MDLIDSIFQIIWFPYVFLKALKNFMAKTNVLVDIYLDYAE